MARREIALLFLISAPCGRASHLAGAHAIGLSQSRAEVKRSEAPPRIPDVSGDVSAAEDVLAKVNTSWADMQDLFSLANQTAVDFADSAIAKVDDVGSMLPKVQAAVDAIGRMPFAPGNTEAIQDLVDAFIGQVNASTQVARDKIAAAERPVIDAIQPALDRIREVVEAVMLKFRRALEKVAGLADTLEKAVSDVQQAMPHAHAEAAPSFMETAAKTDNVEERFWPFSGPGAKKESVWSTTTSAIKEANETLRLFAEKVDGINGSLMEIIVLPMRKAAQDAMNDFLTDCNGAVYHLPDLVSAEASSVCSVAGDFNGASKEALGKLENRTADVVANVKNQLASVFGMVESLSLLVAKTQHIVGVLEDRAAAAAGRTANAGNGARPLPPPPSDSREMVAPQPEQPGKGPGKP